MIDWSVLNTLDWIILVILIWSIINGVWYGFSNEFFGLIGLIAAFIITSVAGRLLDHTIANLLPDTATGRMISRAIVFIGCVLLIKLIVSASAEAMREVISRPVDHTFGMLFGFVRGSLIILLPFLLVNLYIDPKVYPDWLVEAHSYPYLTKGARLMRRVLPDSEVNDKIRTDFGALKKAADNAEAQEEILEKSDKKQKIEKEPKPQDSSGNSKWNNVIETLKETAPVDSN